jgi:hypothetical protein
VITLWLLEAAERVEHKAVAAGPEGIEPER